MKRNVPRGRDDHQQRDIPDHDLAAGKDLHLRVAKIGGLVRSDGSRLEGGTRRDRLSIEPRGGECAAEE